MAKNSKKADSGLVLVMKGAETLEVSPLTLQAHLRRGWVRAEGESAAAPEAPEAVSIPLPEGMSLEDAKKALEAAAKAPAGGKGKDKAPEEPEKDQ